MLSRPGQRISSRKCQNIVINVFVARSLYYSSCGGTHVANKSFVVSQAIFNRWSDVIERRGSTKPRLF